VPSVCVDFLFFGCKMDHHPCICTVFFSRDCKAYIYHARRVTVSWAKRNKQHRSGVRTMVRWCQIRCQLIPSLSDYSYQPQIQTTQVNHTGELTQIKRWVIHSCSGLMPWNFCCKRYYPQCLLHVRYHKKCYQGPRTQWLLVGTGTNIASSRVAAPGSPTLFESWTTFSTG